MLKTGNSAESENWFIAELATVPRSGTLTAATHATVCWIADRLQMGCWTYVSNLLREKR